MHKALQFLRRMIAGPSGDGLTTSQVFKDIYSGEIGGRYAAYIRNSEEMQNARNMGKGAIRAMRAAKVPAGQIKSANKMLELNDYFNVVAKYGFNVIQLAFKNPHIGILQDYVQTADKWYNEKMSWISRATQHGQTWMNLKNGGEQIVGEVLFELDAMSYLSKEEVQKGVIRMPSQPEFVAILKSKGVNKDNAAEIVSVIKTIRGDFSAILDKLEAIMLKNATRDYPDPIIMQIEAARIKKEMKAFRAKPYFPHARFGKYNTVIRNMNGEVEYVEAFESKRQRTKAMATLRQVYPVDKFKISFEFVPQEVKHYASLPAPLLRSIKANMKLSKEQRMWLDNFILEQAPEKSFRKHFVQRKSVKGFSKDAVRGYADYFWHAANHIARIEHGEDMNRQIELLDKQTTDISRRGADVTKRREIVDYLRNHLDMILYPGNDWASLRALAFQWWIGFSPASAALNFTQTPLVTVPYLSKKFGWPQTKVAWLAAMAQSRKERDINVDPSEAEAKMFELGIRQGFIDEGQATELAQVAEGGNLVSRSSPIGRGMEGFFKAGGLMFQMMEKFNRKTTFRMTVNLMRSNPNPDYEKELLNKYGIEYRELQEIEGFTPNEAMEFLAGKDAIRTTQFEYSRWARPRFMQGKKGVIFTFFSFVQNMLFFTTNVPGGRRYLLTMLLMGGVMGLPGAEDLEAIAKVIGRQVDPDFDPQRYIREFYAEIVGEEGMEQVPPDLILRGAARTGFGLPALGDMMGLPIPKIDMSRNIGMGQIVPGLSSLGRANSDFESTLTNAGTDVAGASYGIGFNFLKFLMDDKKSIYDLKRWETTMPRAMKSLSRSYRWYAEERERSNTGSTVLNFDPRDPEHMAEIAAGAMGFQPTRLTRQWDLIISQREKAALLTTRRNMLLMQYDWARQANDKEAQQNVISRIKLFNSQAPKAMSITQKTISRSMRTRELSRLKNEKGIAPSKMLSQTYQEVLRLHPEADINKYIDKSP